MPHRVCAFASSLLTLFVVLPALAAEPPAERAALIPWPRSVEWKTGRMEITARSRVVCNTPAGEPVADVLIDDLARITGLSLKRAKGGATRGDIVLLGPPAADRAVRSSYHLAAEEDVISIFGDSFQGLSYGTATLLQLLDLSAGRVVVPAVTISDEPALAFNGTMLDVARKPYSIETLQQCVDVCRFYKIRSIQLHMTDENAWTFPSKAFPQLGSQNFAWAGGEKPTVYPVERLRALVAYADARGVTLIPEIEMPGHSGQLRGSLPEIFGYRTADGKLASVGVINMTSEKALAAIDTLIGEACDIFHSSPYIHIGCDEASLGGLEQIPEVVEFLKARKETGTHVVFNEFVHKVHAMVAARKRQLIVWEGAPNAPKPFPKETLWMPWVGGSTLAAELVRDGYRVINAPWGVEKPYFDVHKVNGAQLARGEPKLFGATSILWESTEDRAVPYLRFTGALRSEPTWSPDSTRTLEDFVRRIDRTDATLDRLLCGFTLESRGVLGRAERKSLESAFLDAAELRLVAAPSGAEGLTVRYTLDGSEPVASSPKWDGAIRVAETTTLKARRFAASGEPAGNPLVRVLRRLITVKHDAIGARVTVTPDRPGYAGPGPQGLTDGRLADGNEFDQQGWIGWETNGQPLTITLDLGKATAVRRLGAHCLRGSGGVFPAAQIDWSVSDDGTDFRPVGTSKLAEAIARRGWYLAEAKDVTARYVRLQSTASNAWTFFDEITVNGEVDPPTLRHLAVGKPVTLAAGPTAYDAPGTTGLTDGYASQEPNFLSLEWLGFEGRGVEATIDLGEPRRLKAAGGRFLQDARGGIYLPTGIEVLVSDDGKEFRSAGKFTRPGDNRPKALEHLKVELRDTSARYVRIKGAPAGQWQFVDELIVE